MLSRRIGIIWSPIHSFRSGRDIQLSYIDITRELGSRVLSNLGRGRGLSQAKRKGNCEEMDVRVSV
jgi:hypothetical protein